MPEGASTTGGWDDPATAELYDRFAREHALYRDTSRDLIRLARIEDAEDVVDLACGTGVTTEAILQRAPASARVLALDASRAMLDVARARVTDERVTWVRAPAVGLGDHVTEVDAIVCNSAIWQLEMERAIAASARVLRPGGRLGFTIGRQFLMLPLSEEELRPRKPSLYDLIQAIAVLEHDYAPLHPVMRRSRPMPPDQVVEMLRRSGLEPAEPVTVDYDNPPEAQLAWLQVPVFANNVLPGMGYEEQLEVLDAAYARWEKPRNARSVWMVFVATRP